jgi:hypothetical protein
MIIFKGNKLNEMAILVVSSDRELSFKVTVKSPDHLPPHAHVMDKETDNVELGQFLISDRIPSKPDDIKDYKQGITDDIRRAICKWARLPHRTMKPKKNWEVLNFVFGLNGK